MLLRSLLVTLLAGVVSMPVVAQDCDEKKAATAPMSRFKAANDGTLIDRQSKKVWLRCSVGMTWENNSCAGNSLKYTFRETVDVIDEMNAKKYAGRSDWRLPTVEELGGIAEKRCFKPAIDLEAFPYSPESGFWTSTPEPGIQRRVALIHFLNGERYIANKNQTWRIRLIAGK